MRERPILFSAPMVRAILEGQKTQTRRVVKRQPAEDCCGRISVSRYQPAIVRREELEPGPTIFGAYSECGDWGCRSPYGAPGDRLWVKETHAAELMPEGDILVAYRATCDGDEFDLVDFKTSTITRAQVRRWRPSIHMRREWSRITLEVTGVRVERLQEISSTDARAEGMAQGFQDDGLDDSYEGRFITLWSSIHGPESWAANPWVWVVEFRRLEAQAKAGAA